MKRLIGLLLLACSAAWGHEYAIEPVRVDLRATEQTLQATIQTNAAYWCDRVLGVEVPPPSRWPQDLLKAAKAYIDARFHLSIDGKRLDSLLLDARYIREPWQEGYQSRLVFEVTYPRMTPGGQRVSGRAFFFTEYRKELAREVHEEHDTHRVPQDFRTILELRGRSSSQLTIPLETPDFEFPLSDLVRSPWQEFLDRFLALLKQGWSVAAGPCLALALAALVWYARSRS